MKHPLITMSLYGLLGVSLLGSASILGYAPVAHAANSNVEATIQSYGDLSMFYQAMLNSGVLNTLNPDENYTIFAPTDRALARLNRETYPCFYSVQCRPQIANLMRNHIIEGRHDLADLVSYGYGIPAESGRRLHVEEPYVGDYAVDGHTIISKSDVGGNIIYRIDGVIASPQDLAPFRAVTFVSAPAPIVTKRTVTRTYVTPEPVPATGLIVSPTPDAAGETTTTTTTIRHYP